MNAAIAALAGAVIGFVGNALSTWINRYFDEKKARRELMVKTAWDQWSTEFNRIRSSPARLAPLEVYLFHTLKVVDLATRTNLSNEQIVARARAALSQFVKPFEPCDKGLGCFGMRVKKFLRNSCTNAFSGRILPS